MSFLENLIETEGGNLRIISAVENNKPAWFVLILDKNNYKNYKKAFFKSKVNIEDYGSIIESGWGKLTKNELDKLKTKYKLFQTKQY